MASSTSAAQGHNVPGSADVGLSRRQRLLSPLLFKEAFDGGPQWPGRTLVMWLRRADDASCRLGVVASKRTFHDAVQRNRARRLLREAFRLNRHLLGGGADVVLLARRRILDAKRQDVERDLLHVCRMAGILQDGGAR